MKVKRDDRPKEASITSIKILTQKVEDYFTRYPELNSQSRYYPENPHSLFPKIENGEVDIILFGNAFKSLMASGLWPAKKVRLWCFSSRFKNFLEQLFPGLKVNLIARNELFPKQQNIIANDWSTQTDLVYAGRISAQKNIESLIYTTYFLQQKNYPCTLRLVGDFDDHYHEHLGRRIHKDYKKQIDDLIESLEWKSKPVIHPKTAPDQWMKLNFQSPVAISLSTYFCEDFGVSLAQAYQEGWPIICSDFGGHADLDGDHVYKCDSIPHSHLPLELIREMSERLTHSLTKDFSRARSNANIQKEDKASRFSMLMSELDVLRRNFSERLGPVAHLIALDELSEFADTTIGASVINQIETHLFSNSPRAIIIHYDCDRKEIDETEAQELKSILNEIPENYRVELISSKNIFFKDQINKLMGAELIYLNLQDDLKIKTRETLQQKFGMTLKN
jgi:hypothetical protein